MTSISSDFYDVDLQDVNPGDFILSIDREIDFCFFDRDHEDYFLGSINKYDNPYPSVILNVNSINRDREDPSKISSINTNANKTRANGWLNLQFYTPKFKKIDLPANSYKEFKEAYNAYLKEKMQQGDLDAMVLLAEYLYDGRNYGLSKQYLELASEQGHAFASYRIAEMYRMTFLSPDCEPHWIENREENYKSYIERSAEQGNRIALCTLAYYHQYGKNDYPLDAKKAFELYYLSAEQDYPYATCNVADKYEFGVGVEQDYAKALDFYHRAAKYRIPEAFFSIGNMYLEGKGVEKDLEIAKDWLKQASFYGNKKAKKLLLKLMD